MRTPPTRFPGILRWLIVLCGAVASLAVDMATKGPVHAWSAVAQRPHFEMGSGPLDVSLREFARAAGINLSYEATLVVGLQAPALRGTYAAHDGLHALLAGSGLEAIALPGGGFSLRRAPFLQRADESVLPLPPVTVSASAPGELPQVLAGGHFARNARLGLLGNLDVMDAPFSVVSYTAQGIADQQAHTVGDVLATDASVRYVSLPGGILDAFTIRGFPVGNGNFGEIAFDGLYGIASNYRISTAYVERVELIKGPTAPLLGMAPGGSVGGGINIVPKRATIDDRVQVSAEQVSFRQRGASVDFSRRLGEDRQVGIRVNGNVRDGDTNVDQQSRNAGAGALALDYRGNTLRASLDYIFQTERMTAPSRLLHILPGIVVPAAPNGGRNISQPWQYSDIRDQSLLARAEYDIADGLTWVVEGGGGRTDVDRLFSITPTIINEAGDVSVTDSNYRFSVARQTVSTGMKARFTTGAISHRFSLIVNTYRDRLERGFNTSAVSGLTNIYMPAPLPSLDVPPPASVPVVSETRLSGVAVADTMSVLDERLQLTLGVRSQRIRSVNFGAQGAAASEYDQAAWTPMAGLVLRPWREVSLYANFIEGLSKGDTAPENASNAGEVFAPYKSRQVEAGARLELGGAIASISAFQITRPSGEMTGTMFTTHGDQRNRGLELNVYGEPVAGFRLFASATVLDASLRSSRPDANGKSAIGVPAFQANLGAEWDTGFAPGLTLTAGLAHAGSQYVDRDNTQRIPHATRVDLGGRLRTRMSGVPTTFRLTVRNVLDKHYWSAVDGFGGLAPAEPRTLLLSATMTF